MSVCSHCHYNTKEIINTVGRLAERRLTTNAGDSKETAMLCSKNKYNHSEGDVSLGLTAKAPPFHSVLLLNNFFLREVLKRFNQLQ